MKKKSYENILLFYIFICGIIFSTSYEHYFTYFITLINITFISYSFLYLNKTKNIITLLSLSFIGIDYHLFSLFFLYFPLIFTHKFNSINFSILLLLLYSSIVFLSNSIIFNYSIINFVMWLITFFTPLILFMYFSKFNYNAVDIKNIINFFIKLISLQIFLLFIQFLCISDFKPGDWAMGSLHDANKVTFYLIILLVFKIFEYFITDKLNIKKIIFLFLCSIMIIFCDGKSVILSFLIGLVFYSLIMLKSNIFKNKLLIKILIVMFVFMIINLDFFVNNYFEFFYGTSMSIKSFIENFSSLENFSNKYLFYNRIFLDMFNENKLIWIFGTGPGTLGSRASNFLSYDTIYTQSKNIVEIFILPKTSYWVKIYLADLWTEDIVNNVKWHSAVLTYPFSGINSLKAEIGLVGIVFYIGIIFLIIQKLFNNFFFEKELLIKKIILTLTLVFITIPILLLFDNYQEQPQIMIPLFLISSFILKKKIN